MVLAETDDGWVVLLDPDALAACEGSIDQFTTALEGGAARAGLSWPG